jgi:hypothetical protein
VTVGADQTSSAEPFTVDPAPSLIQHVVSHGGSTARPSTTLTATPTSGDLLVAVLEWNGSGTPLPPAGWTLAIKRGGIAIFAARPSTPAPSVTIGGTSLGGWILELQDWTGVGASSPVDKTAFATSGTLAQTVASSGLTTTTAQPGDIAVGAIRTSKNVTMTAPTAGFSPVDSAVQGTIRLGVFAKVAGPPAPEGVSVTLSSSATWRGDISTFRSL